MTRDLSPKQVADRIGMSADYVRRHVELFPGSYRIGCRWRIPEDAIERFRADRRREQTNHAAAQH